MQRWHLTAALAGTAALVALFAPGLGGRLLGPSGGPSPLTPDPHAPLGALDPTPIADPAAPVGGPVQVQAGLDHPAVLAGQSEERLMVITLTAPRVENDQRRAVNIALVLDRSGSMGQQDKMSHAQAAMRELVSALQPEDRVALLTFSDTSTRVQALGPASDRDWLFQLIDAIVPHGGTNLYAGLSEGLREVASQADPERVNRVLLLSDGQATVGVTDPTSLITLAASGLEQHVGVSAVGVGVDYNEDLLAAMADRGNGTYHFVGQATQLSGIFREELQNMSTVVARGAFVDVDLSGATLVEVYGYDAQITDDGFRVQVGDLTSGETRKLVARVRVRAGQPGEQLQVAQVALDVDGQRGVGSAAVTAEATTDREKVAATVNRELAILGNQAASSALMDKAARAYADGKKDESLQLMEASRLVAGEAGTRYRSEELQGQAARVQTQADALEAAEPASAEGRYEVKKAKESSRGWSRGSGTY